VAAVTVAAVTVAAVTVAALAKDSVADCVCLRWERSRSRLWERTGGGTKRREVLRETRSMRERVGVGFVVTAAATAVFMIDDVDVADGVVDDVVDGVVDFVEDVVDVDDDDDDEDDDDANVVIGIVASDSEPRARESWCAR
jgi:hypothetical protein